MISFRPHTLKYASVISGYEDEKGDYIAGRVEFTEPAIPCRFEPNGKASSVAFADGRTYVYQYVVYLDRNCRTFDLDEIVRLYDADGNIVAEYKVQGFHRGQLNSKLWL